MDNEYIDKRRAQASICMEVVTKGGPARTNGMLEYPLEELKVLDELVNEEIQPSGPGVCSLNRMIVLSGERHAEKQRKTSK